MSINLLTSVPGGGKTSYAVWNVIKDAFEIGHTIYTVGIPKLTIPTIERTYEQVREWFEIDINDETKLPELRNFDHGSIIVVDEVQRLWPSAGSKVTPDIKELSVHRHYGLTFFLITQSPTLLHRNVLALVDRHLHIRVTWSGRKIYEWPEYCRTPGTASSRSNAVTFNYKLPADSFALYHSSTQHIKPKKGIPKVFYILILAVLCTIGLSYTGFQRILAKTVNPDSLKSETVVSGVSISVENFPGISV